MSEKRYIIVSPSHHKKPRVMFLSEPDGDNTYIWRNCIDTALLFTLPQAQILAKVNPIGMYFVEHSEVMQYAYKGTEKTIFSDFMGYADNFGHEIIRQLPIGDYPKNVSPKTQAAPEAAPAPKKCVGYVLYTKSNKEAQKVYAHYKSDGIFTRIAGIIADAYRTREDAQFAADILNSNGDTNFGWQVEQIEF